MITFSSSTFSGSESSGVITAAVIISGGIVSSEDITVPVSFSSGNASGMYYWLQHAVASVRQIHA